MPFYISPRNTTHDVKPSLRAPAVKALPLKTLTSSSDPIYLRVAAVVEDYERVRSSQRLRVEQVRRRHFKGVPAVDPHQVRQRPLARVFGHCVHGRAALRGGGNGGSSIRVCICRRSRRRRRRRSISIRRRSSGESVARVAAS